MRSFLMDRRDCMDRKFWIAETLRLDLAVTAVCLWNYQMVSILQLESLQPMILLTSVVSVAGYERVEVSDTLILSGDHHITDRTRERESAGHGGRGRENHMFNANISRRCRNLQHRPLLCGVSIFAASDPSDVRRSDDKRVVRHTRPLS